VQACDRQRPQCVSLPLSVTLETGNANDLQVELKQILTDLGLRDSVELEQT
jgi:hypothetical protein